MKTYRITFQVNTIYIYTLGLSNFVRHEKPTTPLPEMKKRTCFPLKV